MKTLSFRIPEYLDARIESLARRTSTSKSAVIRDAIEKMLAEDGARPSSRLDLIADLVGCVKGPGDLSWNKKHLDALGVISR